MFGRLIARQLAMPGDSLAAALLGRLWNRHNAALNDAALTGLAPAACDRVLEIGFGGGYLLEKLARCVTDGLVAGVDVSPSIARRAARSWHDEIEHNRVDIRTAAVTCLPFPDAHFTKAVSVNSLFYWPDHRKAFTEIARVLAPAGLLVLVFTRREDLEKKWFVKHGVQPADTAAVCSLLEQCGFGTVQVDEGRDAHRRFVSVVGSRSG